MFILSIVFSACKKEDQSVQASSASAATSKENKVEANGIGHIFDATFTKWITDYPNMVGFVGGDVGTGTFKGEVISINTVGYISTIEAIYHFYGKVHSFSAHVFVTEDDTPGVGTAVETGYVTDGWLKGASLTGEFNVMGICPIPTPGNAEGTQCYQGVVHIHVPKTVGG